MRNSRELVEGSQVDRRHHEHVVVRNKMCGVRAMKTPKDKRFKWV